MKFARGETDDAIKMCMEIIRLGECRAVVVTSLNQRGTMLKMPPVDGAT